MPNFKPIIRLSDIPVVFTTEEKEHIAIAIIHFGSDDHPMPESKNVGSFSVFYIIDCVREYFNNPRVRNDERDETMLKILDEIKNAHSAYKEGTK